MVRKIFSQFLFVVLLVASIGSQGISSPKKAEAAFDYGNLCSDAAFTNWAALDLAGVQKFLISKGSFLQSFTQNGLTAAQIITYAARDNKINPIAILATIQKEEGIIYGANAVSFNQTRVDWAMGYGYTDSIIYEKYKGFTNQVTNGTWQLRRNYDYWATNGSIWNVGNWMTIDGQSVHFGTKCTSSLYRYTPHLGGNYNFNHYFVLWGGEATYVAKMTAQGPYSGPGAYGVDILPNQKFTVWVNYLNTGSATWYKGGVPTSAHLGAVMPAGRQSAFLTPGAWGNLVQSTVPPGSVGTFQMTMQAPLRQGLYYEWFQPVVQYVGWMGAPVVWILNVSTAKLGPGYQAKYVTQGPWTGPGAYGVPMAKGQQVEIWVNLKNTGSQTWYRGGSNPTHLGTALPYDRKSVFLGGKSLRLNLVQSTVPPGYTGTFKITITAPQTSGTYYEVFQPVTEYVTWFGPLIQWQFIVK